MRTTKKTDRVYFHILRGLETGRYRIGERIPTERDMANQFKVSRPTATNAIRRLVRAKLVSRTIREGSVVIDVPTQKPLVFGAIILDQARRPDESIFSVVAHEISRRAAEGHSIVMLRDPSRIEQPNDPDLFARYLAAANEFINRKVDGVFLMPQLILPNQHVSTTADIAKHFAEVGIPVVLIDGDVVRYPERSCFDLVGIDNFYSGLTLARHFLKRGCRKIDFFAISMRHPTQEARIAGYMKAMEEHGIRRDAGALHYGDLLNGDFVLETLRQRQPEAVLVVNDFQAAAVMRQALQAKIKVPEDLCIGSFDDLPMSVHLPIPLTTIRQPVIGMGTSAYQVMLQRINDPGMPPVHIAVKDELIIRASSDFRLRSSRTVTHKGHLPVQ